MALALGTSAVGCSSTSYRARFTTPSNPREIDTSAPFLKCHTHDGRVYVLQQGWHVDVTGGFVTGEGILYDADRKAGPTTRQTFPLSDVVLFETNRPETVPRGELVVLGIVTVASLTLTALCLSNPKACFGSCPTFYASDGTKETLQAEGFSASVARVFEDTDVDHMWSAQASGGPFDVLMTNEALETHAVDRVTLLAAPRPSRTRVLRAGDVYFPATVMHAPRACQAPRGSCLADVEAPDDREYLSLASERDLAEKETLLVTFPPAHGNVGLAITARNSLLNTFVFYQGLAYMGRRAGEWFARLDGPGVPLAGGLKAFGGLLGDIEVEVETRRGWERAGAFVETGPIAREVQLVPLPDRAGPEVRVRLTLAKGNWKIDRLALAELGEPITPLRLEPVRVTRDGHADPAALQKLREPGAHLLTYPGDAYRITFEVPEGDHELFLESRGYYYEWMREDWLKEEDPAEVARILLQPEEAMRRLAPKYKRIEADMEHIFWQSRFARRP
jgi:hypothetical protein